MTLTQKGIAIVALLAASYHLQAQDPRRPAQNQPASYAFASELGSGVYQVNGRSMQIYRIPFSRVLLPIRR